MIHIPPIYLILFKFKEAFFVKKKKTFLEEKEIFHPLFHFPCGIERAWQIRAEN